MSAPAPELAPDLTAGLRRLKLAAMRRIAPELLVTAKTQRWNPEEFLRTMVEAETAARDASNARARLKTARLPCPQDSRGLRRVGLVRSPGNVRLPRLPGMDHRAREPVPGRPRGHRESHVLVALGHAAVEAGRRVRYFSAAELVETLYRGLADNSVGRVIETLRCELVQVFSWVGSAASRDRR